MKKNAAPNAAEASAKVQPGIRGALLVIVLWLGVIDPIYSTALNLYVAAQAQHSNFDWTYIVLRAAMRICAATAFICSRKATAVWFALIIIWFSGPAYVLGNWAIYDNQIMPTAMIRSTAIAVACTLYLIRSKRVEATYGFRMNQLWQRRTDTQMPASDDALRN